MNDLLTDVRRTAVQVGAFFGVVGLLLGAYVGIVYDASLAWLSALIMGVEAGLAGAVLGAAVALVWGCLRASFSVVVRTASR